MNTLPYLLEQCTTLADRWLSVDAYRYATMPARRAFEHQQAIEHRSRVMVFFYHRVADTFPGPWTISTANFQRQMRWLKDHFAMVSMAEALRRLRDGSDDPCVHVTFDDGYADNCRDALPLLVRENIPCTYFVATGHLFSGEPFGHDVSRLMPLTVNTPQQVCEMAAHGIEIGAHTRNHIDLEQIDDRARIEDEIIGSKQDLEQLTGQPVRYFAYPFGRPRTLTSLSVEVCRKAGFEAVCSAYGGYNFPGDDPYHLQRMHGDNDLSRFKNWATLDVRKMNIRVPIAPVDGNVNSGAGASKLGR